MGKWLDLGLSEEDTLAHMEARGIRRGLAELILDMERGKTVGDIEEERRPAAALRRFLGEPHEGEAEMKAAIIKVEEPDVDDRDERVEHLEGALDRMEKSLAILPLYQAKMAEMLMAKFIDMATALVPEVIVNVSAPQIDVHVPPTPVNVNVSPTPIEVTVEPAEVAVSVEPSPVEVTVQPAQVITPVIVEPKIDVAPAPVVMQHPKRSIQKIKRDSDGRMVEAETVYEE